MNKINISVQNNDFVLQYFWVIKMLFGNIYFDEIPQIGFTLNCFGKNHVVTYGTNSAKKIEIAYINSGTLKVTLGRNEFFAQKGSIVVLFRHLPLVTETVGEETHSLCTALAEFLECEFSLVDENDFSHTGFLIPFIVPPSPEAEQIGKRLYKISSAMAEDRDKNELSSAVEFLSILRDLDKIARLESFFAKTHSTICEKICRYIDENIDKKITLKDISYLMGKTPNYLNYVFKNEMNTTIISYINRQKAKKMATLLGNFTNSFKDVCELVGLCDKSYGYRLFKRYIGVTPKEYLSITTIKERM